MPYAKLNASGLLTDFSYSAEPGGVWPDGSQDVFVNAIPAPGQYTYDAVNQVAVLVPPRKPRTLLAIYNDLVALAGAQKTNIWTDLTSGSPIKISLDVGKNADSIFLIWRIAANTSLPAATITDMKITAATYYVQDNPKYLVNPSFDATINVPGDQLA